ncbi:nucleoside triphosphate pyrophosphohydrolase [Candidatus Dependentiae bacterium]|nr:nucleoside triphosphate pyrophosphohydrolase [Candidatus Dependentiae bacterium]
MSKLVRDKIPEILSKKGIKAETRILTNDQEYLSALCDKLLEEVSEFIEVSAAQDDEHIKEELADVLEVINAICKLKEYDFDTIEDIRKKKQIERGGFEERIFSIF